jgi:hypothetical protein
MESIMDTKENKFNKVRTVYDLNNESSSTVDVTIPHRLFNHVIEVLNIADQNELNSIVAVILSTALDRHRNFMPLDTWLDKNESWLNEYAAETGSDRELNFDREQWEMGIYDRERLDAVLEPYLY